MCAPTQAHALKPLTGSRLTRRCYGSQEYRDKIHRPHKAKANRKVVLQEVEEEAQHDDEELWSPDKDNPEYVNEDRQLCVSENVYVDGRELVYNVNTVGCYDQFDMRRYVNAKECLALKKSYLPRRNQVPTMFVTHNVNGLRRFDNSGDMSTFCKEKRDHFQIISFVEVKVPCHADGDRSRPAERYGQLMSKLNQCLPNFKLYCSFSSAAYGGNILAVRDDVSVPMVRYNLLPPAEEYEHKHNEDGRLIVAEFPELLYVQAYVPHVGVNDRAKVIRRRAWDKTVHEFFYNWRRVSNKPYIYQGDLNIVHKEEDLRVDKYKFIAKHFSDPVVDACDVGYPGDTSREKVAFTNLMVDGRFVDAALSNNVHSMTWRGQGSYTNILARLDYFLLSESRLCSTLFY